MKCCRMSCLLASGVGALVMLCQYVLLADYTSYRLSTGQAPSRFTALVRKTSTSLQQETAHKPNTNDLPDASRSQSADNTIDFNSGTSSSSNRESSQSNESMEDDSRVVGSMKKDSKRVVTTKTDSRKPKISEPKSATPPSPTKSKSPETNRRNPKPKGLSDKQLLCLNIRRGVDAVRYPPDEQATPLDLRASLGDLPRVKAIQSSFPEQDLAAILDRRLQLINRTSPEVLAPRPRTCADERSLSNSCDQGRGCLQKQLPADALTRISQLTGRANLRLQAGHVGQLQKLADQVRGTYDIIFLSAASDNHYVEAQALLHSLHTKVFPHFSDFAFLFYDLGLSPQKRKTFQKYCRCQILDYDRSWFPEFASDLEKFAWKPFLIKAHAHQARVVVWMDASIRFFDNPAGLKTLLTEEIEKFGVMVGHSVPDNCFSTCRATYHKFGDEPCAYLGLPIFQASVLVFRNDPFVQRAVLEPWAACAFDESCIAPVAVECARWCGPAVENYLAYRDGRGGFKYGLCHHFDQSVISLILHKLYLEFSPELRIVRQQTAVICRGDEYEYFSTL
ncbi:hypothetical protein EGW08_014380 [Elysia chlorotica]|uniref:Uncharacterized protein n=1 Tax=Elysia chlorotica TaxID=188477 RepID=A0A3S0ZFS7_ELYCH|nr:hypothetical protein EGW08_014380 [Elysia chlorotica]